MLTRIAGYCPLSHQDWNVEGEPVTWAVSVEGVVERDTESGIHQLSVMGVQIFP